MDGLAAAVGLPLLPMELPTGAAVPGIITQEEGRRRRTAKAEAAGGIPRGRRICRVEEAEAVGAEAVGLEAEEGAGETQGGHGMSVGRLVQQVVLMHTHV